MSDADSRPVLSYERLQSMWKSLHFRSVTISDPTILQFTNELRGAFDKVLLKCFEVSESPSFDFYVQHGYLDKIDFYEHFITTVSAKTELPPVAPDISLKFEAEGYLDGFTVAGALAGLLFAGGAYPQSKWTAKDAEVLARNFCSAVFHERYDLIFVRAAHYAWSKWFYNVAWDSTWIIFDPLARRIWVLMTSDTD